jgi:hypothetical protein
VTGGTRLSGPHWRRVVAALANDDARTAYAQIVLGAKFPDVVADLNDQRRNRAVAVLLGSGLVERNAANELEASEAIFRDLLTQQPRRQAQTGLARFMRLGRIERYPANMAERRELLAWIVRETIEPGEHLTEKQVNERLLSYTDDVVMLRRYMIDFRLLERTTSGSSYSRPEERLAPGSWLSCSDAGSWRRRRPCDAPSVPTRAWKGRAALLPPRETDGEDGKGRRSRSRHWRSGSQRKEDPPGDGGVMIIVAMPASVAGMPTQIVTQSGLPGPATSWLLQATWQTRRA